MKKTLFAFAAFSSFALCAADAVYPVQCWTYMRFEQQTRPVEQIVKDWKEMGITHPQMPVTSEKTDKTAVRAMLDLCQAAGLRMMMVDERCANVSIFKLRDTKDVEAYRTRAKAALADWGAHPAVQGFYLYDEPDSNDVSAVACALRVCQKLDPAKTWYVNLLSWYDWIGPRLGCADYGVYLDRVIEKSGAAMMGYDMYEQMNEHTGRDKGLDLYFTNLRQWMEAAKRHPGFRFNVTQTCSTFYNYVVRSQDDIRWQISTAAAMGAKGITWFYPDHSSAVQGDGQNYRNQPINVFGERQDSFRWLSFENRYFQRRFGSEFMRLTIESAHMLGKSLGGVPLFAKDADITKIYAPEPLLVSFFRDAEGVRYMAAVNLSRDHSQHATFWFADGVTPYQRLFTREYARLSTNRDPVAERDAGGRSPHSAGRYLAPGQLLLVKLVPDAPRKS